MTKEIQTEQKQALRFDDGKIRYDLIPSYPTEQLAKLFTFGAKKYSPNNWKKGMPWSKVEAALRRHLEAYAAGEDFDYDKDCPGCQKGDCLNHSGLYHTTAIMWNAAVLTDYYRSNPQFDDRLHSYLKQPKIVLDIDEVVCDWSAGYREYTGNELSAKYWDSNYSIGTSLDELSKDENFWVNFLKVKNRPDFVPHAYVSSRGVPVEWTQKWIQKNDLPCKPVIHVPWGASKVAELQKLGAEIFIDDRFENFREVQTAGITSFLMDASHNQHWNVGYKRIKDLKIRNIIR